ncbi:MAG: DUF6079 family protein [Oscillospiraceae bacterium]|nr:DUF6079 family protein [Oscillospiraceae bacterium]
MFCQHFSKSFYELTPDMLKTTHFCTKCNFLMGENEVPVKGRLDAIEDRIDALIDEWANTLYITLSDPIMMCLCCQKAGASKP